MYGKFYYIWSFFYSICPTLTKIYAGVKNLRGRIRASISNNRRVFGKNTRAYFKYSRVFWVRWRGSLKRDELYEGPGIETECGRPHFCIKTC